MIPTHNTLKGEKILSRIPSHQEKWIWKKLNINMFLLKECNDFTYIFNGTKYALRNYSLSILFLKML